MDAYPLRDERLLGTTEYMRQALITAAQKPGDRQSLRRTATATRQGGRNYWNASGREVEKQMIDPGENVVKARLASPATGILSEDCLQAIGRWYLRLN